MLRTFQKSMQKQFDAALSTLNLCIDQCPEERWDQPVGRFPFCQVVFHTLFFTDFYLGANEQTFRRQEFHVAHPEFFGDYEQLEDRDPVSIYERVPIKTYLAHCRRKAAEVIADETAETLEAPSGFPRRRISRAELHIYNVRHVQHHAAQLSLRLKIDANQQIPWVASGWCGS